MQRLLLRPVPVQQSACERPPGGGGKREGQGLDRGIRALEVEPLLPQLERAQRVRSQVEHPRDVQLGVNGYRQVAKLQSADGGAGRQTIGAGLPGSWFDGERRHCLAQRVSLTRGEPERLAPDVLL